VNEIRKSLNMDRKTLPINTRDLNRISSLGTKRERELHAQIKKTQNTGGVEKLQSLQDRDPTDPAGPAGPAGPADKGKGKAASTVVPDTAKVAQKWYQDNLAFFTNLPVPADIKDEVLSRLHFLKSIGHRDVHQDDTESQVDRAHELAQRLQ
jgi:nucleoid-associated protein YgaU